MRSAPGKITLAGLKLPDILKRLQKRYGVQRQREPRDPFEIILWEIIGYLCDEKKRACAFEALKKKVGLDPESILDAPRPLLVEIAGVGGIMPEHRADKLREAATIAADEHDGELKSILDLPPAKAKRQLRKFPSIGEPGAEKILLTNGALPVLALDSNGLRVLLRLGYGEEKKSYSSSYKSAQRAAAKELREDPDTLLRAHRLLRHHGRETCKNNDPFCEECPVTGTCAYFGKRIRHRAGN